MRPEPPKGRASRVPTRRSWQPDATLWQWWRATHVLNSAERSRLETLRGKSAGRRDR